MVVDIQLSCTRCGYELKSLPAEGDCPECGEPIRFTIIDTVDPAARRLPPIERPVAVGNSIVGVALFLFFSVLCAAFVLLSKAPTQLPIPHGIRTLNNPIWICVSSGLAVVSLCCLVPIMQMCRCGVIQGCRLGIALAGSGVLLFATVLGASRWVLLSGVDRGTVVTVLFDTLIPVVALAITFVGFRRLIPRIGQRSREFRFAQGSRQRMNDLLAALIFVVIGRICVFVSSHDSNLATLGLIIMVLCMTLVLVGLLYLVRNTYWIRSALCSPPPSLSQLLRSKST
jgi:hypothetical protein